MYVHDSIPRFFDEQQKFSMFTIINTLQYIRLLFSQRCTVRNTHGSYQIWLFLKVLDRLCCIFVHGQESIDIINANIWKHVNKKAGNLSIIFRIEPYLVTTMCILHLIYCRVSMVVCYKCIFIRVSNQNGINETMIRTALALCTNSRFSH